MLSQAAKMLRQLDDEITSSPHHPKELLIRRNSFTPLCRLPPEIIARVLHFTQVASSGSQNWIETPWIDFDVNWVEYTRVCRRLRDVALETPNLWTFIVHSRKKHQLGVWALLCAERSKDCLLEIVRPICHDVITPADMDVYASVDFYLERAGKVHTYVTHDYQSRMVFDHLDFYIRTIESTLPFIEHFSCRMPYIELRPGLLGGSSGSLTRLTLLNVVFGDESAVPSFPALRSLELVETCLESNARQFATFLFHTPRLEHLAILDPIAYGPIATILSRPITVVSLPHLRTLHISSKYTPYSIYFLLSSLPRPSQNCYLEIGDFYEETCEDLDSIPRFLLGPESGSSLPGYIRWSANMGTIEVGTEFDLHSPARCRRVFYIQGWTSQYPIMPSLAGLVHSVHFIGQACESEHIMKNLGSHIRHIIVENVTDVAYLPPGFNDWICERASTGQPLDTLKVVRCGESLREYAEGLEEGGMVADVYMM